MKTYLITGASGFIGSHLAEYLLKEGNRVINVDNFCDFYGCEIKIKNVLQSLGIWNEKAENLEELEEKIKKESNYVLKRADIRDMASMEEIFAGNKIDTVIHLAAMAGVRPSIENPFLYEEVNIRGTMNILELCRRNEIKKIIMASSSSVYGNNDKVPFAETDVVDYAISPYAATKKACEVMSHVYHSLYKLDIIQLRFFTVYGPRQRPDLAIHKFTRLIDEGKEIPFYGDGTTQRDYTYIDDIIDGITKAVTYAETNTGVFEILNLGESRTVSLAEMVSEIEKALNKRANIKKMEMQPGDVMRTNADISKAKRIIGYSPSTEFSEGIKKFIEWYKS